MLPVFHVSANAGEERRRHPTPRDAEEGLCLARKGGWHLLLNVGQPDLPGVLQSSGSEEDIRVSLPPLTRDPGTGLGPLSCWTVSDDLACRTVRVLHTRWAGSAEDRPDDACSRGTEEARGSWPCV